jgi:hypothetical protein
VKLAGAALALVVLFGSAGIAAARSEEPTDLPDRWLPSRAYGVVTRVDGSKIAAATPVGSVTIIADDNTLFRISDVEDPGVDDLAVGDLVAAAGWWEERPVFHAFVVARVAGDHLFPLAGELVAAEDDSLTVRTPHGTATVNVTPDTRYRVPGAEKPDQSDLDVGSFVKAEGTVAPDGALTAELVVGPPTPSAGRWQLGKVGAIGDLRFVLHLPRRRVPVAVGDATRFRIPGVENPSLADLQTGDIVAVRLKAREAGTVGADLVVVLPAGGARVSGEVSEIRGTTLRLATEGGPVSVETDTGMSVRISGVDDARLADVKPADHVVATGTW